MPLIINMNLAVFAVFVVFTKGFSFAININLAVFAAFAEAL